MNAHALACADRMWYHRSMKTRRYFKAKTEYKPLQLSKEQDELLSTYAHILHENMSIDMLAGLYAEASLERNEKKKQECARLMVERAKMLLESAEKLAS